MKADDVKAQVTYQFRASPESVFDAWITGAKVRRWFGQGLGEMTRVAIDARVGGAFSFVQRRGLDDVEHVGKYEELDRPNRIVFTWIVKGTQHPSRVVIDIVANDGGSEVTLVHELHPHWANYIPQTENAWNKMLAAMAAAIE